MRKILFVLSDLDHGGVQHNTLNLCRTLKTQKNVAIDVISYQPSPELGDHFQKLNIPVTVLEGSTLISNLMKTRSFIAANRPDIVVTQALHLSLAIRLVLFTVNASSDHVVRISTIASRHYSGIHDTFYKLLFQLLFKSQKIFAVSRTSALDLISRFGIPSANVKVLPDIIQSPKTPIGRRKEGLYIVIARLVRSKRIDLAIRTFELIRQKNPQAILEIIGDGPESTNLKQLVAKLGLSNSVKFCGAQQNPWNQHANPEAILITSESEGLSRVALEAIQRNVPVIATSNLSALKELGEYHSGVFLAEPCAGSLADCAMNPTRSKSSESSESPYSMNSGTKRWQQVLGLVDITQPKKVATIIPTWNRRGLVSRAIDSALSQTYPNHDIYVVDDGSTDGTFEFLRQKYGVKIVLLRQQNKGPAAARNIGIRAAKDASWVAFLDSDDWWEPNKLQRQVDHLEAMHVRWCYSNVRYYSKGHFEKKTYSDRHPPSKDIASLLQDNCIPLSSVIVDRKLALAYEGFDERREFKGAEDWHFWLRLCKDYRAGYIHEPLAVYNVHTTNTVIGEDPISQRIRLLKVIGDVTCNNSPLTERAKSAVYRATCRNLFTRGEFASAYREARFITDPSFTDRILMSMLRFHWSARVGLFVYESMR